MNEELKVIISAEISNLKANLGKAKNEVEKFGKTKQVFKDFGEDAKKVGKACSKSLAVVGKAVLGAATALLGLSAATEEYRINQAKLETAFLTAGGSAATATQTYNDLYRVLGEDDVAVEAAGHLAQLTTNQSELSEWTNICQGVYATFGDSLPIESLTEAANETAKTGELTGGLADALNWAGVSEDDFKAKLEACNTESEREQLIRTTLNGLYSEAAAGYETNAAAILAQNEAQARLNTALANVGAAMAPVNTAFTNFAAQLLEKITPHIESFVENHLPKLIEILGKVAEAIGKAFEWVDKNWETISTVAPIILGIVGAFSALNAIMGVVQGVMSIFTMNPIVLAIGAVGGAIVLCITNWEKIQETVGKVVETITGWVGGMKDKVVGWFKEMGENITNKVNEIKENVSQKFEEVKENISEATKEAAHEAEGALYNMKMAYETNGGGIKGIAAATMEGVKGAFNTGYTFLNTLTGGKLDEIKNKFQKGLEPLKTAASTALENIKQGFKDKFEGAKEIVGGAIEKIKGFFNFKWELPKLKMPHFSITGKFSLNPLQVPKFSISWNKLGGVFDKPTLFNYGGSLQGIGEDGAEAVVPLERNTKWMNILAEKLAEKQGNTPIILQVDGKTFAETSINTINNLTRQTGKLGLNLI